MKNIYLDNNASTAVAPEVIAAMVEELQRPACNPASTHQAGRHARGRLQRARDEIASFLQVESNQILFTSGGTESIHLLISGILHGSKDGHIITASHEHASVLKTVENSAGKRFSISYLSPGLYGAVTKEQIEDAIQENTRLIILGAANAETGVKIDIEAIANIAKDKEVPLILDGVAILGKDIITLPLGVSGAAFSGHKIHAPKGVGFCFIRDSKALTATLYGGSQEYNLRAGTQNMPGIIALAKAIALLHEQRHYIAHMQHVQKLFENHLKQSIPNMEINGEGPRISNTSNIYFPGIDAETLLMLLDKEGIMASHGSACSSGALEPSKVLLAMGYSVERARSSVRFSLSRYTTEQEALFAAAIISDLVAQLRSF